jgi:predicted ATP-dependent endonuclease of OLD family
MTKIKTITVHNLKAIKDLTVDFNGCTAIITGGNNKGKTSFLRGVIDRLKGLAPDMIVQISTAEKLLIN